MPDLPAAASSDILAVALHSIDYAVFERHPGGDFRLHGEAPDWIAPLWGEGRDPGEVIAVSDFLQHFIEIIARPYWNGAPGNRRHPVSSGIWSESDHSGVAVHLEATALTDGDGINLLLVRQLGNDYAELQSLAQRANQSALQHRKLSSEVQKKDVLLKCIVHDLNNPLSTVLLSLQRLAVTGEPASRRLAETALAQARRQRDLIKSVSELFSTDLNRFSRRSSTEKVETLVAMAGRIVGAHLHTALQRSVSISLENETAGSLSDDRLFRAEAEPFQRALENLVLNALRFAPRDSTVFVRVTTDQAGLQFTVEDSGPGVEPDLLETLFDPFTQGTAHRGNMGLGLYFCRMTVERWGGTIRYLPTPGGGSRFEISLSPAPAQSAPSLAPVRDQHDAS